MSGLGVGLRCSGVGTRSAGSVSSTPGQLPQAGHGIELYWSSYASPHMAQSAILPTIRLAIFFAFPMHAETPATLYRMGRLPATNRTASQAGQMHRPAFVRVAIVVAALRALLAFAILLAALPAAFWDGHNPPCYPFRVPHARRAEPGNTLSDEPPGHSVGKAAGWPMKTE